MESKNLTIPQKSDIIFDFEFSLFWGILANGKKKYLCSVK
jgi:hypothetical protein